VERFRPYGRIECQVRFQHALHVLRKQFTLAGYCDYLLYSFFMLLENPHFLKTFGISCREQINCSDL